MIEISSPQSPEEWEAYYRLRWETLRAPWGHPPGSEKDEIEKECVHLQAKEKGMLLGVCRLQLNDAHTAQVRFMGVSEKARGKGVGKKLMEAAENRARQEGRVCLILQARENAVNFYRSCGYTVAEKTFLLWGEIQHYLMKKTL